MNGRIQRCVALGCTAGALMAAGTAEARTIRGAVVHHNLRAHSFVVATRSGRLFAIHAHRLPHIGSRVVAHAHLLRDGTYRLERARVTGRVHRAVRIRGVVSWVDHRTGTFTVSAPGVSMLVVGQRRNTVRATGASIAASATGVGSDVVVTGTVDRNGELQGQDVRDVGTSTGGVGLEGVVESVDMAAGTITVSADDSGASGSSIVVTVPSTLDITQFTVGEEVELLVQPTGTDTATLLGSADDSSAGDANDQGEQQGEDPGDQGDQNDQGGSPSSSG